MSIKPYHGPAGGDIASHPSTSAAPNRAEEAEEVSTIGDINFPTYDGLPADFDWFGYRNLILDDNGNGQQVALDSPYGNVGLAGGRDNQGGEVEDDNHDRSRISSEHGAASSISHQGPAFGALNQLPLEPLQRSISHGTMNPRSNVPASANYASNVDSPGLDLSKSFDETHGLDWESLPLESLDPSLRYGHPDQFRALSSASQGCSQHQRASSAFQSQHGPQPELPRLGMQQPITHGHAPHPMAPVHGQNIQPMNNIYPETPALGQSQDEGPGAAIHNSNGGYVPIFANEADFRAHLIKRQSHRTPSDFPGVAGQQALVARLYEAVKNTVDIHDSVKVAAAFGDDSIPDEDIQIMCWEVMFRCRDSQEFGPLVAKYHGTKHEEMNTFTSRIECVIAACRDSKAVCKQGLAPSFLDRLVDQPQAELKRKACNQRLNAKKTGQNKAGQEAIKRDCADAKGMWKDPNSAPSAQPFPDSESSDMAANRHGMGEEAEDAPAPKRARRGAARSDSSSYSA